MKQCTLRSLAINVPSSLAALLFSWSLSVHAETASALQEQLDNYPHTESVSTSQSEVRNYEIGLGAMEKFAGQWQFKHGERVTGVLQRNTWRLLDGYTSNEVLNEAIATLENDAQHELLFSCDGRSCGQGVQWANRVFKERILYGREEMQRYRVYSLGSEANYRVLLFSAARSAERQYLHMEIVEVSP
ncbi:MAG: DUF4892 domain-containing protein [Halioglobus sp.]